MKVLVNCLGIKDSGGLKVLWGFVQECKNFRGSIKIIFLISDRGVYELLDKEIRHIDIFKLRLISVKNNIDRLIFENLKLNNIVKENNISLVYNFTGSYQFFSKVPQLVKMQNLLFYSKELDKAYAKTHGFFERVKAYLLKAWVFRYMLSKARFIECQANHVAKSLSDFIDLNDKKVFIKSDIMALNQEFCSPAVYDFSKPIKFLFIVGPHFRSLHKNLQDFTCAMLNLLDHHIDFEIHITLNYEELNNSKLWDQNLNSHTKFHGYVTEPSHFERLFSPNTILISTSIVETIGLHVVEAIQRGLIVITPNANYSHDIYGPDLFTYDMFDAKSLEQSILSIIEYPGSHSDRILGQQAHLRDSEISKYDNTLSIFKEVINV